jgi:hypothetical protein
MFNNVTQKFGDKEKVIKSFELKVFLLVTHTSLPVFEVWNSGVAAISFKRILSAKSTP